MTFGRIRCTGTPTGLKRRYGGGYTLQVGWAGGEHRGASASASGCDGDGAAAARAAELVTRVCPDARLEARFPGQATFALPEVGASGARLRLSAVFRGMMASAGDAGIVGWTVGQVSLDTVFSRVVRRYRGAAPVQAGGAAGAGGPDEDDSEEDEG
jgi:hypothetical protein